MWANGKKMGKLCYIKFHAENRTHNNNILIAAAVLAYSKGASTDPQMIMF
jgi:hypothetical protein